MRWLFLPLFLVGCSGHAVREVWDPHANAWVPVERLSTSGPGVNATFESGSGIDHRLPIEPPDTTLIIDPANELTGSDWAY